MTKEEAIKKLNRAAEITDDTEVAHGEADRILCKLLISLGYKDVVAAWEKVDKWYA